MNKQDYLIGYENGYNTGYDNGYEHGWREARQLILDNIDNILDELEKA